MTIMLKLQKIILKLCISRLQSMQPDKISILYPTADARPNVRNERH